MSTDGGGWTRLYGNYSGEASSSAWALRWDTVINLGKNFGATPAEGNFLLPMKFWARFSLPRLTSTTSGSILLNGFDVSAPDYKLNFNATGNSGMDYHQNRPLSTVDRDNDSWGSSCSNYGQTFGWYRSCCNLCMTTGQGGWPGSSNRYWPSDWNYKQTDKLEFWAR